MVAYKLPSMSVTPGAASPSITLNPDSFGFSLVVLAEWCVASSSSFATTPPCSRVRSAAAAVPGEAIFHVEVVWVAYRRVAVSSSRVYGVPRGRAAYTPAKGSKHPTSRRG